MEMVLGAIFALVIAWLLVRPHLVTRSLDLSDGEASSRTDSEGRTRQMLDDLELDFATEKLSEEEYGRIKLGLEQQIKP